jgi:hypothetical protein
MSQLRVDLHPMPESALSPSQGLLIRPLCSVVHVYTILNYEVVYLCKCVFKALLAGGCKLKLCYTIFLKLSKKQ